MRKSRRRRNSKILPWKCLRSWRKEVSEKVLISRFYRVNILWFSSCIKTHFFVCIPSSDTCSQKRGFSKLQLRKADWYYIGQIIIKKNYICTVQPSLAAFVVAILIWLSLMELFSLEMVAPKYLKLLICTSFMLISILAFPVVLFLGIYTCLPSSSAKGQRITRHGDLVATLIVESLSLLMSC